jgi:hypothetical protein
MDDTFEPGSLVPNTVSHLFVKVYLIHIEICSHDFLAELVLCLSEFRSLGTVDSGKTPAFVDLEGHASIARKPSIRCPNFRYERLTAAAADLPRAGCKFMISEPAAVVTAVQHIAKHPPSIASIRTTTSPEVFPVVELGVPGPSGATSYGSE